MIRQKFATLLPLIISASPVVAQDWIATRAPSTNWNAVTCSADGSRLVAAVGSLDPYSAQAGPIYTSTNFGIDWAITTAPIVNWDALASSADGTRLLAAVGAKYSYYPGPIWISTNSGEFWMMTAASATNWWAALACSADGTTAVAVVPREQYLPGGIYTSADGGMQWSLAAGTDDYWSFWVSVASSANGARLAAVNYARNTVAISTNLGATWLDTDAGLTMPTTAVCSSADGQRLAVVSSDGGIFTSADGGRSWNPSVVPAQPWVSVACSADGTRLVAVATYSYNAGTIWTSTNSGASWVMANVPTNNWTAVASSADGCKLVATAGGASPGLMYTWQTTPTPLLSIACSASNVLLAWTVSSMNFVPQQNSDLATTNWTEITIRPTLNYTNLQYEVDLQPEFGPRFYRLCAQ